MIPELTTEFLFRHIKTLPHEEHEIITNVCRAYEDGEITEEERNEVLSSLLSYTAGIPQKEVENEVSH